MIVHWMRVGFVHGVMNTDNMSILGLTIDYGPYGWLEDYNPGWTPNTTDAGQKRYCFGNQPQIAQWNLVKLANAIFPLLGKAEPLQAAVDQFVQIYQNGWQDMMAKKIGLSYFNPETDDRLIKELFEILELVETDMTIFFRSLSSVDIPLEKEIGFSDFPAVISPLMAAYYAPDEITQEYWERFYGWFNTYCQRIRMDSLNKEDRQRQMDGVNPRYVLRNYLAQLAIEKAEQGDFSMVHELLDLIRHPYAENPGKEKYAEKRPEWARVKPGCSMLSCSS